MQEGTPGPGQYASSLILPRTEAAGSAAGQLRKKRAAKHSGSASGLLGPGSYDPTPTTPQASARARARARVTVRVRVRARARVRVRVRVRVRARVRAGCLSRDRMIRCQPPRRSP